MLRLICALLCSTFVVVASAEVPASGPPIVIPRENLPGGFSMTCTANGKTYKRAFQGQVDSDGARVLVVITSIDGAMVAHSDISFIGGTKSHVKIGNTWISFDSKVEKDIEKFSELFQRALGLTPLEWRVCQERAVKAEI